MCHPERRGISPLSGEMERSRTFAGRGCDICNLLQKSAPQQAKAQIFAKGECAAGSVMGFLNVCSASVAFFMHPILLTFK